jgi:hypothetical protein
MVDGTGRSRMVDSTMECDPAGPSRLAYRLHANVLSKRARTIPANGESDTSSMAQVGPERAAIPEELRAG